MWDIARGADSYVVYAVSSQGYKSNFSNIDTTFDFQDLRCGQDYNITVVAENGGCRSQPSKPFTVSTGTENEHLGTKSLTTHFKFF